MILDLLDTRTNKLVFRGAGATVIGGPESNADKIRDAVKKRVAALPSAATRGVLKNGLFDFVIWKVDLRCLSYEERSRDCQQARIARAPRGAICPLGE